MPTPPIPDELLPEEYYARLEAGLSTLLAQCAERMESDHEAELAGRFIELFELWNWGAHVKATVVAPSEDRRRRYPVWRIARLCQGPLDRIAEAKRTEIGRPH